MQKPEIFLHKLMRSVHDRISFHTLSARDMELTIEGVVSDSESTISTGKLYAGQKTELLEHSTDLIDKEQLAT